MAQSALQNLKDTQTFENTKIQLTEDFTKIDSHKIGVGETNSEVTEWICYFTVIR